MRYMVFCFDDYCPRGGLDDIILMSDCIQKVKDHVKWFNVEPDTDCGYKQEIYGYDNLQVYDTLENKTVYSAYKKEVRGYNFGSGMKWKKEIIEEVNLVGS